MNREEAEIVKKTGGKGPGNCKSRRRAIITAKMKRILMNALSLR